MRRVLRWTLGLAALLALIACGQHLRNSGQQALPDQAPNSLRIATLNVHYIITRQQTGAWSLGDWERRRGPMDAMFNAVNADIFALQESESFPGTNAGGPNLTLDWLLAQNPEYAVAAHGPAAAFPPTQPILYRPDRLTLVDQGWFFFSDTPDVIYARTFNGSFPAFASWAQFRAEGQSFTVLNAHLEYSSRSNRLQSAALIAERIAPWIEAGEPVIVLGDFNARGGAETLRTIEEAGITFAPISGATYHFNRGLNLFGAIDHIGTSTGITGPEELTVLREQFDGEWPTDHYPVVGDFTLP